jgi:hypothetical protein
MTNILTEWTIQNIDNANYIGVLDLGENGYFEILSNGNSLIFGNACNTGLMQSGYMDMEEGESIEGALSELLEELETYYRDNWTYCNRIVVNERM